MNSLDRHSAKIIIRRRTLRPALGALLLSCTALCGEPAGDTLWREDFSYPLGPIGGRGAWAVADPTQPAEVVQAPLEYGEGEITLDNNATGQALSLPPEANLANAASRKLPPLDKDFFFSALLRTDVSAAGAKAGFAQLWFSDGSYNFDEAVPSLVRLANGELAARIGKITRNSGLSTFDGQTHLVVLHVEKVGGSETFNRVSLYVNPTTASLPPSPDAMLEVDTGKPLINLLGFRTMPPSQSVEASDTNHFWGAFRIANTWEGVVQP
jgi:hypothetical protein